MTDDTTAGAEVEPVSLDPPAGSSYMFGDVLDGGYLSPVEPWIHDLLYPGCVSTLAGEPGVGKSWAAVSLALEVIRQGGSVIVLDFEDTVRTWATRLRALLPASGVTVDQLGNVAYYRGIGAPTEPDRAWLPRLVGASDRVLVVVDSVAEAMAAAGLDENSATEVTRWYQEVPRPLALAGATVVVLDHLAKDAGSRGRWARGSGAKLAAVSGVAYTLTTEEPFSRWRSGACRLTIAKDRHGSVGATGDTAALVHFSVAGGTLYSVEVERTTPVPHGDRGPAILRRTIPAGDF